MFAKTFAVILVLIWARFEVDVALCNPISEGSTFDFQIEPAVVAYLSDHLEPNECAKLCNFLALRKTNSNSKGSYNPKNSRDGEVLPFGCHRALKRWSREIAQSEEADALTMKEYAENVLKVGLKEVRRDDLAEWLSTISLGRLHEELSAAERNWEKNRREGFENNDVKGQRNNRSPVLKSKNKTALSATPAPGTGTNNKDYKEEINGENDIPTEMIYVMILAGSGFFVLIVLAFTICFCSRRKTNQTPRRRNVIIARPAVTRKF